ncbi:MAG: hypothetical protein HNEKOMLI_00172 [Sodalis sp. Psp]|nr:hypothetical protein [Sodalis sp. Psp]MCR3756669.1 hypothetical protein [Sodalis sp. Ppy]
MNLEHIGGLIFFDFELVQDEAGRASVLFTFKLEARLDVISNTLINNFIDLYL